MDTNRKPHSLQPADVGSTILTPQEIKDLHRVEVAVKEMREGKTMTEIAEGLGISRPTLWKAFQNPTVMATVAGELNVLQIAEIDLIRVKWIPILANMARIAVEGGDKDAISAARFLHEVRKFTGDKIEDRAEGVEEEDAAEIFLKEFGRPRVKRTLKARKKLKGGEVEATIEYPDE